MTTPTTTPNDYPQVPLEMIQLINVISVAKDTIENPRFGPQRSFTAEVPWTKYPYTFKFPAALPIEPNKDDHVWCRVKRENIKVDQTTKIAKPGDTAFDFWWGITAYNIEAPEPGQEVIMGAPAGNTNPQPATGTTTYSTAQVFGNTATVNSDSIEVRGDIQGHLEKLAVDLYIGVMGISLSDNLDQINYQHIRMIRDRLYHNVKDELIRPLYYCYEHGEARYIADWDTGLWIHALGTAIPIEGASCCAYQDSISQPFFVVVVPPEPVVEQAPAEQPVVEQAVQATLEPATDGLPGGSARE